MLTNQKRKAHQLLWLQDYENSIIPSNNHLYERVERVSNQLLKGNQDLQQINDKDWTVTVIDQPFREAFVLQNGNIFVFKGMLDFCTNDDQLAIVLGHEMAHALLGRVGHRVLLITYTMVIINLRV